MLFSICIDPIFFLHNTSNANGVYNVVSYWRYLYRNR